MKRYLFRSFVLCMVFILAIGMCLPACATHEISSLKAEYREAIDDEYIVALIEIYYTAWGEAIERAKENNDIFEFCYYSESLELLRSEISTRLYDKVSAAQKASDKHTNTLIATHADMIAFSSFQLLAELANGIVNTSLSFGVDEMYAMVEGLRYIVSELKLLPESDIEFESIDSLNERIIERFSKKYDDMTRLYFQ